MLLPFDLYNIYLYNNRDHGLYGITSCSHSLYGSKLQ